MKNISTLTKGRITELKCVQYFLELGYIVSTPEIPYKYDFLLDIGNRILKVQVKTSHPISNGEAFEFRVISVAHNSNGYRIKNYGSDVVDYFCTFYENECYLIPFQDCGSSAKTLRLKPPNNGQIKNIVFANNYIAKNIIDSLQKSRV